MQQPLVSVVVPAYNHARYVVEAVESVLAQNIDGLECVVIDDASTDDTRERLATLDDPRVRVTHHDTNRGAHATLTEGLDAARGRVLAVLNSDDRYLPGRLAECIARIDAGHDLVGSDIRLIDGNGAEVREHWWIDAFAALKRVRADGGDWVASLLEGNVFMTTSNMVFTRELWQRLRPLRNLRYVNDYDLVLRALINGAKLDWIDHPLLSYRLHDSNTISENPLNANLECTALLREHLTALIEQTTDRKTALKHLTSQWARNERYEVEILRALNHQALSQKDHDWNQMVKDRDQWICERDELIRKMSEETAHLKESSREVTQVCASVRTHNRRAVSLWSRVRYNLRFMQLGKRNFPAHFREFGDLKVLVEKSQGHLKAISFDVFDTLVQRCVEPPEWIHQRVAHELARALEREHDIEMIWAARRGAEARLRLQANKGGGDHECHYDELLRAWVEELCGRPDEALIARAQGFEARLEHLALHAKPGAAAFLAWARERDLRCIAVSDMYLGEKHVREILAHCGLEDLLDAVHISSEHGLAKYSTRLHAHVLELEGLEAAQVLHVGDNIYSDALAPCRIGMHGAWFDDARARRRRRRQARSAQMAARGGIWPGRMQAEIVAERIALDTRAADPNPYFRYGLEVLGPIFSLFTLGLVERLRARTPDRLMFLARDGHLFMHMYARWRELDDDTSLPDPDYVYASRRVVASAAVADGLTPAMIPIALANPKQRGLESILKTYGLPVDEFDSMASRHGLQPLNAPLNSADDTRLATFLDDEAVQAMIRTHGRRARARLEKYFEQQGFFGSRDVAFVDIGWNGTIQHFLAESFGARVDYPKVAGYYFALVNSFHAPGERCGLTDGLLLDGKRNNPCERAAMDFEELFEQGARALEATTLGYDEDADGRITPLLKGDDAPDRREELACNPRIAALQQGVLAHLEHFHAAQALTGFDFETLRPYGLALIERAVVYPERDEVALVGGLAHSEDFGHDHVLDISGGDIGWRDILRPRRLSQRLRAQAWRYAPFARFRNPMLAFIARVQHLRHFRGRG